MTKQPFKLPKHNSFEVDLVEKEFWYDKVLNAKKIITFIKSSKSEYECYFSGLGVEELGMILILFGRYPQVCELFYSAVVNMQLYENDEIEGFNYTISLEENLKKLIIIK